MQIFLAEVSARRPNLHIVMAIAPASIPA